VSCGQKAAAEDEEAEYQEERLKKFKKTDPYELLGLFERMKGEARYLDSGKIPLTSAQRSRIDKIEEIIWRLP
jgi:hypothetical protein